VAARARRARGRGPARAPREQGSNGVATHAERARDRAPRGPPASPGPIDLVRELLAVAPHRGHAASSSDPRRGRSRHRAHAAPATAAPARRAGARRPLARRSRAASPAGALRAGPRPRASSECPRSSSRPRCAARAPAAAPAPSAQGRRGGAPAAPPARCCRLRREPPRPAARSAARSARGGSPPRSPPCWLPRGNRLTATAARGASSPRRTSACTTGLERLHEHQPPPDPALVPAQRRAMVWQRGPILAVQRAHKPRLLQLGEPAPDRAARAAAAWHRSEPTSSMRAASVGQPSDRAARTRLKPSMISSRLAQPKRSEPLAPGRRRGSPSIRRAPSRTRFAWPGSSPHRHA
jgi:hypothetical protein